MASGTNKKEDGDVITHSDGRGAQIRFNKTMKNNKLIRFSWASKLSK